MAWKSPWGKRRKWVNFFYKLQIKSIFCTTLYCFVLNCCHPHRRPLNGSVKHHIKCLGVKTLMFFLVHTCALWLRVDHLCHRPRRSLIVLQMTASSISPQHSPMLTEWLRVGVDSSSLGLLFFQVRCHLGKGNVLMEMESCVDNLLTVPHFINTSAAFALQWVYQGQHQTCSAAARASILLTSQAYMFLVIWTQENAQKLNWTWKRKKINKLYF